ncbi:unnamed protein product [Rhodiola kirilowii]
MEEEKAIRSASGDHSEATGKTTSNAVEESEDSCELKYGSYCLWRRRHREEMKDSMVKKLKDLLFVARAYYPSVAKLPRQEALSHEMKQNIQEFEHIFSEAITDADLPHQIEDKVQKMESAIAKAKLVVADCTNVDKKLQQLVVLTEDEARFHMKQTSVVINSTVVNAKESGNQVFHVITDKQNYFAMKFWFYKANYLEAAVEVLNIEELELPDKATLQLHLPEEYRVSVHGLNNSRPTQIMTEYISVYSHSHYFLPDIFHYLKKIVVMDDDHVVVQQDLSALWSLDMESKVIGAVQRCSLRLGRSYMGEEDFDEKSCLWMSGLNVIDLVRWREQDITGTYNNLMRAPLSAKVSSETLPLRTSYLSFQNQVYLLDDTWAISRLSHDYEVYNQDGNTMDEFIPMRDRIATRSIFGFVRYRTLEEAKAPNGRRPYGRGQSGMNNKVWKPKRIMEEKPKEQGCLLKHGERKILKKIAEPLDTYLKMEDMNFQICRVGRARFLLDSNRMERISDELEVFLDGNIYAIAVCEDCFFNGAETD